MKAKMITSYCMIRFAELLNEDAYIFIKKSNDLNVLSKHYKMRTIVFLLLLVFSFTCAAQNNTTSAVDTYTKKEIKHIEKRAKKLKKLNYSKVIKRYGAPDESSERTLTEENLSQVLSDALIAEHFPTLTSDSKGAQLKEASWKMMSKSWITIWYKLDGNAWRPINELIDF